MSFFFIYLIKLSVSLSVIFLFYHFILRKLTFYNHNRWYLLGYTLLCFFIPFINISGVLEKNNWNSNDLVAWVPVIHTTSANGLSENTVPALNVWGIVILVIGAGMVIMLVRLLLQLLSFHRMMKNALPVATDGMNIYQVNDNIIPFSFGNSIFINRHLHSEKELEEIIRHEFVHVKQRHSLDIIWAELLCLVNWFNPFAWLLRRSIRQNLEFIADHKVLENGISKKEYQYLLLKVIGNNQYSIATQFNFSSLKKRIAMMNKLQTAKVHLLKFLFVLPVAVVMLLAFRSKYERSELPVRKNIVQDTLPGKIKLPEAISSIGLMQSKNDAGPIDPVKHKLIGLVMVKRKDGGKEIYDLDKDESRDDFEKKYGARLEDLILPPPPAPPPPPTLPEGVKDISLNGENMITVTRENGTIEKFNLNKEVEKKNFEKKYGKIPATPIPPVEAVPGTTPVPTVPPVPPARSTDATTPKAVTNGNDIDLSGVSSEYEITDKKAVIKLKNGTVEKYDLTGKQERAAFEKKYGKIIHVNTNINTDIRSVIAPLSVQPSVVITTASPTVSLNTNVSAVISPVAIRTPVSGTRGINSITPRPSSEVTVVDDYGHVITGKEDIIITITKNTTRQELDGFIRQMKEKDIELTYDEIEYNKKGKLVSINGTMRSKDGGRSNFVASDFEKLILAMIRKGEKTWFKVSVKDKEVI